MLVISDLNEDIEYSIPISFIVTLATFSDVNEALKVKSSFHLSRAWQSIRPVLPLASRKNLCKASHKFFKWIKQHLQVKRLWGESENTVRIQIHIAIITYCLIAIIEHDLKIGRPVVEVMRILGKSALTTGSIRDLLQPIKQETENPGDRQLSLDFKFD